MYLVRVNQSCVCNRNSFLPGGGWGGTVQTYIHNTRGGGGRGAVRSEFLLK